MSDRQGRRGNPPPAPSPLVALEVAALLASTGEHSLPDATVALVVASDADERMYLTDSLRPRANLEVVAVASIAAALEAAARRIPHVLVVTHEERAVLRHLPGIPGVLLTEDAGALRGTEASRLAPLIVLRGAFSGARLLEVVASLLGS